ncbi:esterase/lipase family protein [Frateuria aurantia]
MKHVLCCLCLLFGLAEPLAASTSVDVSGYTRTRYPVVLVHGMFGFDSLLGLMHYWDTIPVRLREGGATLYVVHLSPLDSDQVRGEQLLAQLQDLQAVYGYTRFNLIGHSQGGLSSRYVAEVRPDLVASLTTLGTPHQGSAVADGLMKVAPEDSLRGRFLAALMNLVGEFESLASGSGFTVEQFESVLQGLGTAQMQIYNQDHPSGAPLTPCGEGPLVAANGVRYYSMGGTSVLTNPLDASDYVLGIASLFFAGRPNDGLVERCSSHWGQVLRDDYPWNHFDEVNQLFGLRGALSPDPAEVLRVQLNRLKQAGL